jgi:transposase
VLQEDGLAPKEETGVKQISSLAEMDKVCVMGLDLGDRHSTFVALDVEGRVVGEGTVPTSRAGMERLFGDRPRWRIAFEVGTHSPWLSRLLEELGHEVIVANPRQVALIHRNKRKTDRLDATNLARLARLDPHLLAPVHHRGPAAQMALATLRSRSLLVAARTQSINHVRNCVKSAGYRLPSCTADAFGTRAAPAIPAELQPALAPVAQHIAFLTPRTAAADQRRRRSAARTSAS